MGLFDIITAPLKVGIGVVEAVAEVAESTLDGDPIEGIGRGIETVAESVEDAVVDIVED